MRVACPRGIPRFLAKLALVPELPLRRGVGYRSESYERSGNRVGSQLLLPRAGAGAVDCAVKYTLLLWQIPNPGLSQVSN